MRRRIALTLVALAAPVAVASADDRCGRGFTLHATTCVDWAGRAELEEALFTELGRGAPPAFAVRVEPAVCEASPARFELEVKSAERAQTRTKTIDLSDTPAGGRPRVLALVVAELARGVCASSSVSSDGSSTAALPGTAAPASSSGATAVPPEPPEPRAAPDGPLPPRATLAPKTKLPVALGAAASVDARAFPAFTAGLLGGRAGLDATLGPWAAASLDGVFLRGSTRDPLGSVDLVAYGVGATFGARSQGPVRGRFAIRTDALWTTASGVPARTDIVATSGARLVLTVGAEARLDVPLGDRVRGSAAVLAGGVLRGLYGRADERTTTGVAGPMIGITVGGSFDIASSPPR